MRKRFMTSLREKAAELALTIHVMDVMPEDAYLVPGTRSAMEWCGDRGVAPGGDASCAQGSVRSPAIQTDPPVERKGFRRHGGSVTETAVRNSNHQGT